MSHNIPSLQSLLIGENFLDNNKVHQWIQSNISRQEALHEVLSAIHADKKYLHIALSYAEESIRAWNYVHPKILEVLPSIFKNFESLARSNVYFSNFLLTNWWDILKNSQTLNTITSINPDNISPILWIRLIENFSNNFKYNILLREKSDFYKNLLIKTAEKNSQEIAKIIQTHPEKLFEEFGFWLEKWYEFLFDITKTRGMSGHARIEEFAFLKRLWNETISNELQKMSDINFFSFIDRFSRHNTGNQINFLSLPDLKNFSQEKRFYLSAVYSTRIFENYEEKQFLQFLTQNTQKNTDDIFWENFFGYQKNIFELLQSLKISIFSDLSSYKKLLTIAEKSENLIFHFKKYIENYHHKKAITNAEELFHFLKNTNIEHSVLKNEIWNFWCEQIVKFFELRILIKAQKHFYIFEKINNHYEIKQLILNKNIDYFKEEAYRNLLAIFDIFKVHLNSSEYDITSLLEKLANGNNKTKYIARKISQRKTTAISKHTKESIRKKTYIQGIFPINTYHFTKILFKK